MSRHRGALLMEAMLFAAAFMLPASSVLAGGGGVYHSVKRPATPPRSAPVPAVRAAPRPVTLAIKLPTSTQAAPESVYADVRGPEGTVRRFPLEPGRDVIQSPQLVLRPGESLTIHWRSAQ
jgi:hypothetical protein